ncbi:MAG: SPASM domain-containing protein [Magnetococcales bacterium]|nr:SPASM domain-containing protein [Magnetococcales bacterium]
MSQLKALLTEWLERGESFIPRIVQVETRSRCNGSCAFCLASHQNDPRPDELMEMAVYDRILDELVAIDYPNRLSLLNNNEPLLDHRIYDLLAKARGRLPRAYLELKTNGLNLTTERVVRLFDSGLDQLYVNDYRPDAEYEAGRHSPSVTKVMAELQAMRRFKGHCDGNRFIGTRIIVTRRRMTEVLGPRAGTSPNKQRPEPLTTPCFRPFEMFILSGKGKVALCSEDLLFQVPMGDITQQSLMAIWRGPAYEEARRALLEGMRSRYSTCSHCEFRGYTREIFVELGLI